MSIFSQSFQRNLNNTYDMIKDEMNAELKKHGHKRMSRVLYKRAIKAWWNNMMMRVIYKHQEVPFGPRMGYFEGLKILCTEYNPKGSAWDMDISVNDTDGMWYFVGWTTPRDLLRWKIRAAYKWRRLIYQNVVLNGSDYPELKAPKRGWVSSRQRS